MTQQDLADATTGPSIADATTDPPISVNMIGRIETGKTGVSFKTIARLALALQVDPAEFFAANLPDSALHSPKLSSITARLSQLSDTDLDWVDRLIILALERR